jgi:hypothetical protein
MAAFTASVPIFTLRATVAAAARPKAFVAFLPKASMFLPSFAISF